MLAYAASRRQVPARHSSPHAMLFIVSAHVAAIALLMSAKMELPPRFVDKPLMIDWIEVPPDPKPLPLTQPQQHTTAASLDNPTPLIKPTPSETTNVGFTDEVNGPAIIGGGGAASIVLPPRPITMPIHRDAWLLTPQSELKPPYPQSKLLNEEEATLTLRLTIDDQGRVVAVDPVGKADRDFLNAARRHLIAHWRYRPASEDGRPVATSMVITLRFQLDG